MRRPSAQQRILWLTTLVAAVALGVTVLVLRQVMLRDLDDRVDRALAQEAGELLGVAESFPIGDGENATEGARRLLTSFLETNVPDVAESLIAAQDGGAFLQSGGAPADVTWLAADTIGVVEPRFFDASSDAGPVRVLVQPIVADGDQAGALIIAWFTDGEKERIDDTVQQAIFVALAALAVATGLAWFSARSIVAPIGLLSETAREITERDVSRRLPEQGSDEIASLIASFNAMLDRLEHGLDSQRDFLNDAGHELRTPLTIVRGHLEVLSDDPEDFAESRALVLSELDRMTRLVDDLLLLAQAEEFDFLVRGPVDCDELVTEVFRRVPSLGDQDWRLSSVPVGVIEADQERLVQAMLNLATNAARHTPDGQMIEIGAVFTSTAFEMWVADSGEGIDADEHARIFERAMRSSSSKRGRAGLGLAIVKAIAEAHGGDVRVDSSPGEGATFTISLPATPVEAEPGLDYEPATAGDR